MAVDNSLPSERVADKPSVASRLPIIVAAIIIGAAIRWAAGAITPPEAVQMMLERSQKQVELLQRQIDDTTKGTLLLEKKLEYYTNLVAEQSGP